MIRIKTFAIVLTCLALCSCETAGKKTVSNPPAGWLRPDQAQWASQELLEKKGYLDSKLTASQSDGRDCQFTYETTDGNASAISYLWSVQSPKHG